MISNLTVSMEYPYESGLFGRVSGGTVRNLGIENASIISTATLSDGASGVRVGVIAGENTTGTIENCYTAGTIVLENKEGGQRGRDGFRNDTQQLYDIRSFNRCRT